MTDVLVRIEAPHFCAGLVLRDGVCVEAAPILVWAIRYDGDWLSAYFRKRGWKATIVREASR